MRTNKEYPYYEQTLFNSIKEIVEDKYKTIPNKIAFSYRENDGIVNKTFKDVYKESNALASYFMEHYKNKKIAIIGENSYNWIIIYLGIIFSGNTAVTIDKDVDEELLNILLKQVNCKDLFYSKDYCSFIDNMKVNKNYIDDIDKYITLGKKYPKCKYKGEEEIIFFTSGTTGPNKGVVLTGKSIAANIYGATSIFKLSGNTINVLPYHHSFGLNVSIFAPFFYGGSTFINNSLRNVLKDIELYKPETLIVVPLFVETFYNQIWKNARKSKQEDVLKKGIIISDLLRKVGIDIRKKIFSSIHNSFGGNLNYIISGGAYLDPKYIKFFDEIGITILNGYGITECSPIISVNRNFYNRVGTVGVPCRGNDVKIIDGEICVKGESVMKGYYNDKKATKEVIIDGYFHTGDLGEIDKDGFISITGRKKNLIILSNGENISPEVIESALLGDEHVQETVVYSKDGKIIASIFPTEDYLGNEEYFNELIHKYNEDKPKNKQITSLELRETEFIKNTNKKILRNKVMEGK